MTLLVALALLAPADAVRVEPAADVWVYTHASDPISDEYLRVWGKEGRAVAPTGEPPDGYSYAYLRFDVPKELPSGKLVSARLELLHVAEPQFTLQDVVAGPVELRLLPKGFEEKGWDYEMAATLRPEATVLAKARFPEPLPSEGPFVVSFDLAKATERLRAGETFACAVTSSADPAAMGMGSIYKFYSRQAPVERRPRLVLEFAPASE